MRTGKLLPTRRISCATRRPGRARAQSSLAQRTGFGFGFSASGGSASLSFGLARSSIAAEAMRG
ncbi:hypothetical protein, partial [Salinarimonas sp.]|uniref:hypothetical protein n=1 Tax=Salinarimonas sp. TaxID=2766526 RepID=UPI00391914B7